MACTNCGACPACGTPGYGSPPPQQQRSGAYDHSSPYQSYPQQHSSPYDSYPQQHSSPYSSQQGPQSGGSNHSGCPPGRCLHAEAAGYSPQYATPQSRGGYEQPPPQYGQQYAGGAPPPTQYSPHAQYGPQYDPYSGHAGSPPQQHYDQYAYGPPGSPPQQHASPHTQYASRSPQSSRSTDGTPQQVWNHETGRDHSACSHFRDRDHSNCPPGRCIVMEAAMAGVMA